MTNSSGKVLWKLVVFVPLALLTLKAYNVMQYEYQKKKFFHLQDVISQGDINAMAKALDQGADANMLSPFPHRLMDLVLFGRYHVHRETQSTLLMQTVTWARPEIASLLIAHGAHVHSYDLGNTLSAIYRKRQESLAREEGVSSDEVMSRYRDMARILIDAGAMKGAPSRDGGKASMLCSAAGIGDKQLVELILTTGVSAEDRGYAVQAATSFGHEGIFELLHPESVPVKDLVEALRAAAYFGNVPITERLLALGADINRAQEGYSRDTPLHAAAKAGNVPMIVYLVRHGANPDSKNGDGAIPADLAKDDATRAALKEPSPP